MRNYVKAGPIDRADALRLLYFTYCMSDIQAQDLLYKANVSPTGMASRELPDGRRVWVSALVTMPGKYMIEVE